MSGGLPLPVVLALYASTLFVGSTNFSNGSQFFLTTKDVKIEATPAAVMEESTQNVTLSCRFLKQPSSDFNNVLALILSKSESSSKDYSELATVSQISGNAVEVKDSLGAEVSGRFSANNEKYITYTWVSLPSQAVGRYYCEAHGSDGKGHPRISVAQVDVTLQPIENKSLLTMLDNVKAKQQRLEVLLNNANTKNAILENKVSALDSSLKNSSKEKKVLMQKLDKMEGLQEELKGNLSESASLNKILLRKLDKIEASQIEMQSGMEKSRNATMKAWTRWRGHTYYLSHRTIRGVAALDSVCRSFGGYLVEIDDESEYAFVTTWAKGVLKDDLKWGTVAIGATDGGHEGQWTMLRSGNSMKTIHWHAHEPNGKGKENCLFFSASDRLMFDASCYVQFMGRFMCEVP